VHYVKEAFHVGGFRISIRFENDEVVVVDLSSQLDGPVFEPLKDPSFFVRFSVSRDLDTIVWPNGADFSPDFLYEIGKAG